MTTIFEGTLIAIWIAMYTCMGVPVTREDIPNFILTQRALPHCPSGVCIRGPDKIMVSAYTPSGVENGMADYLLRVCRENPSCVYHEAKAKVRSCVRASVQHRALLQGPAGHWESATQSLYAGLMRCVDTPRRHLFAPPIDIRSTTRFLCGDQSPTGRCRALYQHRPRRGILALFGGEGNVAHLLMHDVLCQRRRSQCDHPNCIRDRCDNEHQSPMWATCLRSVLPGFYGEPGTLLAEQLLRSPPDP